MLKAKIAVFVSGGGTNLQALMNSAARGELPSGEIKLVISSKSDAFALERARKANIEALAVERYSYCSEDAYESAMCALLEARNIDVIVLAGFLRILSERFIRRFEGRIINVHPSLIPSFCGKGFYGIKVHEKALERGVKLTGATVHIVNSVPDGGRILFQKAVEVMEGDTPETLQARVMEQAEWELLPKAAELICLEALKGKL